MKRISKQENIAKGNRRDFRIIKRLWIIPVLLALLANYNVLQNGFGWDDETIIQGLKAPDHWWDLFLPDLSADLSNKQAASYFRPLVEFSYHLDYTIWGNRPFGFHFSVWLAHLLNTGLVFVLVRKLTSHDDQRPGQTGRSIPSHNLRIVADNALPLLAASLFAVHPIHSEAVAWIAGRNDVFCTTFLLVSFLLYIRFQLNRNPVVFGLSMLFFFLALLTKENAAGLIFLFPLYEYLASSARRFGLRSLIPFALVIVYFALRAVKIATPYGPASPQTVFNPSAISEMIGAAGLYLKLLFFPYPHQPFITRAPVATGFLWLAGSSWALIIGGILVSLIRRRVLMGIGLSWMSATLAPAVLVAVIGVASTPAAERYLYAPSVGFSIAAAGLIQWGLERLEKMNRPLRGVWPAAGLVWITIMGVWGWESWDRNGAWKNSLTFWQAAVASSPESGFPYGQLGVQYYQRGQYAEAEPLFKRAIAVYEDSNNPDDPFVAESLNNLAALYYMQRRYAEAEPLYRRSLAIKEKVRGKDHPDAAQTLNNLSALYYAQGRYAEAELLSRRSVAIREKVLGPDHPDLAPSLNNLAGIDFIQGKYADAETFYRRALMIRERSLRPDHPDLVASLENYAVLLRKMKRNDEAEKIEARVKMIKEKRAQ